MKPGKIRVSVLVSCEYDSNHLNNLVDDLLRQDYPSELLEIILIGEEGKDVNNTNIQYYATEYQGVEFVRSPGKSVPQGINLGIQQSQGDVIIILDNNVRCYKDLVSEIVQKFRDKEIDCVYGNSMLTASTQGIVQLAIKECLSSAYGNWDSYLRSLKSFKEDFTHPFGCYRRSCFDVAGHFSEELPEAYYEDYFERMSAKNLRVVICPEIKIIRYVPETVSKLAAMELRNSYYKPLLLRINSKATSVRNIFAPVFVFLLLILWTAGLFYQLYLLMFFGIFLVYFIYGFLRSIASYKHYRKFGLLGIMPYVYFIVHGSSGWGYLTGILRYWLRFKIPKVRRLSINL